MLSADNSRTRFDFIVVVAIGRSGSTLVQGMLNGLPRTLIRGESHFFSRHLYEAHAAISRTFGSHGQLPGSSRSPTGAWFGAHQLDPDSAARDLGGVLRRQLRGAEASEERGGPVTLGFKDIQWAQLELDRVSGFMEFLERAVGRVGWVLHRRGLDEVRKSGWWMRARETTVVKQFDGVAAVQHEIRRHSSPGDFLDSDYEELRDDPQAWITKLIDWAGLSKSEALMSALLAVGQTRHGPPSKHQRIDAG
jgi:LPS sulfotransferase NodH